MKHIFIVFSAVLFFLHGCNSESEPNSNPDTSVCAYTGDKPNSFIDDPLYYQQWYLERNETFYLQNEINDEASIHSGGYLNTYTGNCITVAIIDDGLEKGHEDLFGTILATYSIDRRNMDVSPTQSTNTHGTAVTGIIGARTNTKGIRGVAPYVNLIFVQLPFDRDARESEIIEAFRTAVALGADVINCSWGTYDVSDAVRDTIVDISNNGRDGRGIPIVFAAGNDNIDMGNDESSIPEVISVGATLSDNDRAWYSNHGSYLDLLAPGGGTYKITTLDLSGSAGVGRIEPNYLTYNDFSGMYGTSASAPIISGVIATMLEADSTLSRVSIENILKHSSDKIGDISYENGRNDLYGYGKVNVRKAFEMIVN